MSVVHVSDMGVCFFMFFAFLKRSALLVLGFLSWLSDFISILSVSCHLISQLFETSSFDVSAFTIDFSCFVKFLMFFFKAFIPLFLDFLFSHFLARAHVLVVDTSIL